MDRVLPVAEALHHPVPYVEQVGKVSTAVGLPAFPQTEEWLSRSVDGRSYWHMRSDGIQVLRNLKICIVCICMPDAGMVRT